MTRASEAQRRGDFSGCDRKGSTVAWDFSVGLNPAERLFRG